MGIFCLKSFVVLGIFLVVSMRAHAQPLFTYTESIECTVANADLVVIGKLVEFRDDEAGHEREGTIAVEEILKQDPLEKPHLRLGIRLSYPESLLTEWKDGSRRLLVAVTEEAPNAATVIELTREKTEVLTAEFKVLRDPDEVIRAAKQTIDRMPAAERRIHTFRLEVPREVLCGTKWEQEFATGVTPLITVPVDERLEKRALEYTSSKDYRQREEGARALRFFKSDANITRLKKLLDDPGWAYLRRAEENESVEVRHYGVRH